ncbi:MAG: PIG-L family deacetylase [Rhodothermales bacterium]|nr:PIG-L family deacetylase [Rhodothermales bacterium]
MNRSFAIPIILVLVVASTTPPNAAAQLLDGTEVLIVTAHPDDEALFGGIVYRLTKELGAKVDLAVVTDGAGGYKYSVLAEPLYGLNLTDPAIAREYLPGIRKRELMSGGKYIGLRNYYFFDQPDTGYTLFADSILSDVWDSPAVKEWLVSTMNKGGYDFVLVHLPREGTHGHHKSASILALRAARDAKVRPVVLGAWISTKDAEEAISFTGLPKYPITSVTTENPIFHFDRTRTFGFNDRLNYKIVINWLIAEHKTQGTMQMLMNGGDIEDFWLFEENPEDSFSRTAELFEAVNAN